MIWTPARDMQAEEQDSDEETLMLLEASRRDMVVFLHVREVEGTKWWAGARSEERRRSSTAKKEVERILYEAWDKATERREDGACNELALVFKPVVKWHQCSESMGKAKQRTDSGGTLSEVRGGKDGSKGRGKAKAGGKAKQGKDAKSGGAREEAARGQAKKDAEAKPPQPQAAAGAADTAATAAPARQAAPAVAAGTAATTAEAASAQSASGKSYYAEKAKGKAKGDGKSKKGGKKAHKSGKSDFGMCSLGKGVWKGSGGWGTAGAWGW